MTWVPRLRTVLLVAHLLVLGFPLGGLVLLRVYESVLIRRTESELLAQGVVVAAAYRTLLRRELRGARVRTYGRKLRGHARDQARKPFAPVVPALDLARDDVAPEAAPARTPPRPAHPAAIAAGVLMNTVLRRVQRSTLAGIRVLDLRGVVVASTRGEHGRSLAHRREVIRALAGARFSMLRRRPQRHGTPPAGSLRRASTLRVFVAVPVLDGERVVGAVVVSRTPPSVWQTVYRRRWLLLAATLGVLMLVLLLTLLTAWTISRPVRALTEQAERIRRGDRDAATELARPGTREVLQLSRALVDMARALDERAAYIQTFAANVSHEFKTPLTSMRGAVELLRDHVHEMSDEERERFLGNLEADAERLDRLVTGLLELARADVLRPGDERCVPAEVLEAVVKRFAAQGLDVALDVEPGAAGATLRMAPETLDSVVSNLLDNARHHGGDGVRVRVVLTASAGEGGVSLRVEDDGPGITDANLAQVFDRFFTTARERGGSGLGLALVKALVEAHGGQVACESRPGDTAFTVAFPPPPAKG